MAEEKTYNALTGYRALAALLIVFYHSGLKREFTGDFLYAIQGNFNIGVSLFYVLSGLLITMRYSESVRYERSWFRQYFQNRFARIYPIYFCYALFVAFVMKNWDLGDWIIQLGLLVGFAQKTAVKIGVAWSLTTEECFYIAAPFLFYMHKKKKMALSISAIVIAGILLFLGQKALAISIPKINTTDLLQFLFRSFFGRCVEFYFGMKLAFYLKDHPEEHTSTSKKTSLGVLGIIAVLLLLALLKMQLAKDFFYLVQYLIFSFILPIPTVFLIYGLIREKNILQAFLGSKPLVLLGKSSYILYLIHMGPIGGIFYDKFGLNVFWGMIALQLTSICLYLLIEAPAQKIFKYRPIKTGI